MLIRSHDAYPGSSKRNKSKTYQILTAVEPLLLKDRVHRSGENVWASTHNLLAKVTSRGWQLPSLRRDWHLARYKYNLQIQQTRYYPLSGVTVGSAGWRGLTGGNCRRGPLPNYTVAGRECAQLCETAFCELAKKLLGCYLITPFGVTPNRNF